MYTSSFRPAFFTKLNSSSEMVTASEESGAETLQKTAVLAAPWPLERRQAAGELTLDNARELLDWLENNGIDQFEVEIEQSGQFKVVWTEILR
jgi:hypothetical protein